MAFKYIIPPIVNPEGVNGSPYPRKMKKSNKIDRLHNVAATKGEPLTKFEGKSNPYIDYESVDLLLSLQHPRSNGYDEMCFIIMGQTKELLFKSLYFELYNTRLRLQEDDLPNAFVILKRVKNIIKFITSTWDILSTITANGFDEFRDQLGIASGQQSFMYRHVEFILGNKNKKMCDAHSNVPHIYPAMLENFTSPSLYDETIALINRRGIAIATDCLERDWTETYKPHKSIEEAWTKIYKNPVPENDLYMLGEELTEIADLFSQYRWRHFVSVERILGFKPGSGGSEGVEWLRHIVDHRFFPELWSMRTKL